MSLLEYFLSKAWLRIVYFVCLALPVNPNKVVFASARAEHLEGNLRFIHDELVAKHPKVKVVLLLERYSYGLLGKVVYLLRLTRGTYHLATAKHFIVDNAYLPIHVGPHRKATTVYQVWHAGGALKRFGVDVTPPNRVVENRFVHKYYDYVIVGSESAVGPYASALRTPEQRVLPLGIARTDFFFDETAMAAARERVLAAHPELRDRTVVLYAPTFRGHGDEKAPRQGLDAKLLRDRLPESVALVHKTHPVFGTEDIDGTGYDALVGVEFDLNELFTVTDVLVTDYSSSIFEYALTHKPLVLLVDDLEAYEDDPGFYLDFAREMIGEFATTSEKVSEILERGAYDLSRYDAFIATHCQYDDGHASERFVELLGYGE
jgi:teichoic acid ribitol-phosphate primase